MSYKNIYVAATSQHVGKTTTTLGLVSALSKLGYNVGYSKPVGQKHITVNHLQVDKDTVLFADLLKFEIDPAIHSPVILGKGASKRVLSEFDPSIYWDKVTSAGDELNKRHEITIFEGTGHPGVGSVGQVSNAKVAKLLDASVIMVVEGGIGSTIDMLNMCLSLFREHDVPVIGVIINKVIPEKAASVKKHVGKWLKRENLNLLGVVPYDKTLAYPLLWTVSKAINGKMEHYREKGYQKIEKIIAGSLAEYKDFVDTENSLLVVGPRVVDQAIEKLNTYTQARGLEKSPLSGIVITGDEPLSRSTLAYINDNKLTTIRTPLDTYGAVIKMSNIEVKINRKTPWKITKAIELIRENTDLDLLKSLIIQ